MRLRSIDDIYAVDAQFSTPNFSTTFGQQVVAVWFEAEVRVGLERAVGGLLAGDGFGWKEKLKQQQGGVLDKIKD
eukprot:CAMPEP_0172330920 /NCGR_PEP_ID=MMETSP1058-20130122/61654_1 /TAXON_ID=83371 /ORGANISM="Detonula confervacea, Strain CCMP 353" /LENGTH=74 /DNA_ID=CAMNT_0013048157 /DNA_START=160 /DNA_END=384 /DNA_ORIENTATION=-